MKLLKRFKYPILLSILAISFQACSDSGGNGDPTAKAADVAANDTPLVALGKDGALIAKVDIPFPENDSFVVFDNNQTASWDTSIYSGLNSTKPFCRLWRDSLLSNISRGDSLKVNSASLYLSSLGGSYNVQSVHFHNDKDNAFILDCYKFSGSTAERIFTVGNFIPMAGNYFEVNDPEKNLLPFIITEKPDDKSLLSKIGQGSILKWKASTARNEIFQDGVRSSSPNYELLHSKVSLDENRTAAIDSADFLYRYYTFDDGSISQDLSIGAGIGDSYDLNSISWYLNLEHPPKEKNISAEEFLGQTGPDSIEIIDGKPLGFGIVLR